jgi:isopentenyldiphosphate isomerase
VQSGLGIPLLCGGQVTHVVTFLSAESTPLARAFEVWMPDASGRLLLKQSHYAPGLGTLKDQSTFMSVGPGEDVAGHVLASGLPCALSCSEDPGASMRGFVRRKTAQDLGLQFAVGLPIHDGDRLRAVVVMFS